MVDLALLQSISYMAGALGVCVGALSFAFNIRSTEKSRRASLTNNLMNSFLSEEGVKKWLELLTMEWKDFEDYSRARCVDPADQLLDILFIKLTQRLTSHPRNDDQVVDIFDRPEPAVALGDHVVNQTQDGGLILIGYLL